MRREEDERERAREERIKQREQMKELRAQRAAEREVALQTTKLKKQVQEESDNEEVRHDIF